MLACLLLASQTKPFVANAEFGKSYTVGVDRFVIGTKEKLEPLYWRTITLKSARTAQAFGAQGENIIAGKGEKLILLDFNIKNPVRSSIRLTTADTLRVRVWEADRAKSYRYIRASLPNGDTLNHELKTGQSKDVTIILAAPEQTPFVHMGFAYERGSEASTRWYDIIPAAQKSTAAFCTDGFNFGPTAELGAETPFEMDGFRFTVGKAVRKTDHYAVLLTATNTLRMPASWGWQYSSTELQFADGKRVEAYRAVYEPGTDTMWGGQLEPGGTKRLEYRFYDGPAGLPSKFVLKTNDTQRQVTVNFNR